MSQPTPAQLNALLQYAAARLGTTPEALAATVSNGGYDGLVARLSPDNRRALESLLGDPQRAQAFLQHPQVQEFLRHYQ